MLCLPTPSFVLGLSDWKALNLFGGFRMSEFAFG